MSKKQASQQAWASREEPLQSPLKVFHLIKEKKNMREKEMDYIIQYSINIVKNNKHGEKAIEIETVK